MGPSSAKNLASFLGDFASLLGDFGSCFTPVGVASTAAGSKGSVASTAVVSAGGKETVASAAAVSAGGKAAVGSTAVVAAGGKAAVASTAVVSVGAKAAVACTSCTTSRNKAGGVTGDFGRGDAFTGTCCRRCAGGGHFGSVGCINPGIPGGFKGKAGLSAGTNDVAVEEVAVDRRLAAASSSDRRLRLLSFPGGGVGEALNAITRKEKLL